MEHFHSQLLRYSLHTVNADHLPIIVKLAWKHEFGFLDRNYLTIELPPKHLVDEDLVKKINRVLRLSPSGLCCIYWPEGRLLSTVVNTKCYASVPTICHGSTHTLKSIMSYHDDLSDDLAE